MEEAGKEALSIHFSLQSRNMSSERASGRAWPASWCVQIRQVTLSEATTPVALCVGGQGLGWTQLKVRSLSLVARWPPTGPPVNMVEGGVELCWPPQTQSV